MQALRESLDGVAALRKLEVLYLHQLSGHLHVLAELLDLLLEQEYLLVLQRSWVFGFGHRIGGERVEPRVPWARCQTQITPLCAGRTACVADACVATKPARPQDRMCQPSLTAATQARWSAGELIPTMVYLEHQLRHLAFTRPPQVSLLRLEDGDDWAFRDLEAEILDLYPEARVQTVGPAELMSGDLVVVPLLEPFEFPLQDVLYRRLDDLARLTTRLQAIGHVMLYRARWREVDVVASKDLRSYLRRKRLERALVGALGRHPFLRALLLPAS
jgi:hypothetical protein